MMPGPQFETPAQISALKVLGADVVGMTASGEVLLSAELNLPFVGLALSSNYAAGLHPDGSEVPIDHHSVDSLASEMQKNVLSSVHILLEKITKNHQIDN